jgi:glycosyltransferase involved in cell wall biosynthesis
MKKVLIITYYWPPSGGSGVQRWLKFVKYLPAFGWEPHVFTPENPSFAVRDPSLERDVPHEAEVIHFPIWEPYDMFFKISRWFGQKKQATPTALLPAKKRSVFETVSTWIRGNLFIPDPRIFWVKPSVKFLTDYVTRNKIEIIVTTGPPHSVHLIGLKLKKKLGEVRWLADFRDPWSEWGMWDSVLVSKAVRKVHRQMERQVLTHADEIVTITPFYVRRFEQLANRRVRLLTNGFDPDDFRHLKYRKPNAFVIRHVGIVNEKCDPRPFMNALIREIADVPEFAGRVQIEFIGEVHPAFKRYVAGIAGLQAITTFTGSVPHKDLIELYGSSSLLLLVLTGYKDAEGFLPGKLFEYLATGIRVLGVGPTGGDAALLLEETHAGRMVAGHDEAGIREALREVYREWMNNPDPVVKENAVQKFSRKEITGQLAAILSGE